MASTTIPFPLANEILESSITSYNWLTSLPPPLIHTIPQYTPALNEVHHAVAVLEAMAASMEETMTMPDPDPVEDLNTTKDNNNNGFNWNPSLALRYNPTIAPRPRSRIEKLRRWLRNKISDLSRR